MMPIQLALHDTTASFMHVFYISAFFLTRDRHCLGSCALGIDCAHIILTLAVLQVGLALLVVGITFPDVNKTDSKKRFNRE